MRSKVLLLGAAIFVTCVAASPVWNPQFLSGGSGRNIRHLPCVSRRTGDTGICMFAFACMKANGTHLGTCIDRFYFGSCCRIGDANPDLGDLEHNTIFGSSNNSEDNNIPVLHPSGSPTTPTTSTTISSTATEPQYFLSTFQSVQDNTIDVLDEKSPLPTTTSRSTATTPRTTSTAPSRPSTTTTPKTTTITTTPRTSKPTTPWITITTTRSTTTTTPNTTTVITKRTTTPRSTTPRTTTWPTRYPTSTASTTKTPTKKPTPSRKPTTTTTKKPTRKPVVPSTTKKPITSTKKPVLTTTAKSTTAAPVTTTTTKKTVTSAKTTTPKPVVTTKPPSTTSTTPKVTTTNTPKPSKPTTIKPTPKPPPSKPASKPTSVTHKPATTTSTTYRPNKPWPTKVPTTTKKPPPKTTTTASTATTTTAPASLVTWTVLEEHHATEPSEATEATTGTTESWVLVPVTTHPPTGPSTEAPPSIGTTEVTTNTEVAPPGLTTLFPELQLNMTDYKQVCGRRLFPESRIVGGERSSFGKWPWQISLRQWRTSTYLHKCGAALLNENWAITAAHCVENVPPSDLLLRLGEHDLSTEEEPYGYQERRVQIVASHPQFDPRTFEYDLALLRFYEPVTFQPNILPICVPEDDTNFVGKTAYVTGWGRLYEDGPLPSVLQEVSVPVINNSVCETMYRSAGYIEHIPEIFICAGWRKGGFDSCEGDSGGPMVIQRQDKRWLLAGVISWGIGCAEPNQPGVYTRISEFREWINQILQF